MTGIDGNPDPAEGGDGALAARLARRIRRDGPIPVGDFVAAALQDPEHGYYRTRMPIGRGGDFVTAPEISQMFGELIGLWCVAAWRAAGRPAPFVLAELGPGRGTLMADALRAAAVDPGFAAALSLHLVETSRPLRAVQAERLAAHGPTWHDDAEALPDGPLLVVANEFIDALPVGQFVRVGGRWHERMVALDRAGRFVFAAAPDPSPLAAAPPGLDAAADGAVAERRPDGEALVRHLAARIARSGIAGLVIDYGYAGPATGDTLQAIRDRRPHPPLDDPGTADLTAHVDFTSLARAACAGGATPWGPVAQGDFLRALGIEARAKRLAARADAPARARLALALRRLIGVTEMGTLFRAMAIAPPGGPPPDGFPPRPHTGTGP